jgi:exopolysaccharide biosynthesis polyprenyl glycosylphosphotransferase
MLPSLNKLHKRDLRSPEIISMRRGSTVKGLRVISFIALDSALLITARLLAESYGREWSSTWNIFENSFVLKLILAIQIAFVAEGGFYGEGNHRRNYVGLVRAITLANMLILLIAFLYQPRQLISRSTFILSWALSAIFICFGRLISDSIITLVRNQGAVRHKAFVFCSPDHIEEIVGFLKQSNLYLVQGWADVSSLADKTYDESIEAVCRTGASEVFVYANTKVINLMLLYWHLRNTGITLHLMPIGLEPLFRESNIWTIRGIPLIKLSPPLITGVDFWAKRGFDICFAVLLIVVASPIYLAIAFLIKVDSTGSIFYGQTRVGLHGQPFKAWKFRTMVANAAELQKELEARNEIKDGILFKIKDDPRITSIGKFLRRYSLDELPQVLNVLFGEMSFVGPRPLPTRDVEKFSESHFVRHEVLPGITGLWQVSGRSDIDNFDEVLRLDIFYIQNWSLWLDLKIIMRTMKVVLLSKGAY